MAINKTGLAVGVGVVALAAAAIVGGGRNESSPPPSPQMKSLATVFDPLTQYIGPCGLVVTPPAPNQCQAASGEVVAFLGSLVNGNLFKTWKAANPGEYQRLSAHLANPMCSVAPVGQPQDMVTQTGAAFAAVIAVYGCVEGVPPLVWPAPNPPPVAGAKDKTPPTPPGPVQVAPGP